jgi:hypothetical protein
MMTRVTVNPWDRDAVTTAERYADGLTSEEELAEAAAGTTSDWTAAFACAEAASGESAFAAAEYASGNAAWAVADHGTPDWGNADPRHTQLLTVEQALQTTLLRDIFGNPFRPVAFDAARRTSTVVALAGQMYESRDHSAMPILADALQDAGCDNDVLNHCRDAKQVHVRGCWVVDLVLGKS